MIDRWYDVQDEDGVWRVGECFFEDKLGTKTIAFDGFHPNYSTVLTDNKTDILQTFNKNITNPYKNIRTDSTIGP